MELRWYQSEAVAATWSFLCGNAGNPLVVLPTGAGKSIVIGKLCQDAVESYAGRVLVLAHRKELLQQNADKIRRLIPNIEVGIYSAGLRSYSREAPVVCAGIQSAYKWAHDFGQRNLCIIDEAHLVPFDGEGMYRQFLGDLRSANPRLRVVGTTATPFRLDCGPICRPDGIFQKVCYSAPIQRLIADGYLCNLTTKPAAHAADTSGLRVRAGEFVSADAEALFNKHDSVTAACQEIIEKTAGRQSVLLFCSGVQHAGHVADVIQRLTGEPCGTVTGETLPLERDATLTAFRERRLRWLTNVDVLCLDEKTEILTDEGWVGIDGMTPQHRVACWDRERIYFAPPKTVVRRPRLPSETMVSCATNGIDIRVTSNHRMVIKCGGGRKRYKTVPAESIVGKRISLPAHGTADPKVIRFQHTTNYKKDSARVRSLIYVYKNKYGMSSSDARNEATRAVDERNAMRYCEPHQLSLLECKFIGFWIGDGTFSNGRCSLTQSLAYPDIIKWADECLESLGIVHHRKQYPPTRKSTLGSIRWTLARGTGSRQQKVSKGYFSIEPYLNKDGGPLLWGLNKSQFLALLDGLWLADGLHHAKSPIKAVCCCNKVLLDTLQAIASARGIRTSISKCSPPRSPKHSQQWKFSWCSRTSISIAKKRFTLELDYQPERVWCVTSETSYIVIRRNGKVAVVGNTTGFDAPCIDAIAVLRATMSAGLYAQIVGRGFRTFPGKDSCLVLDFGQNIQRHGPIDAIDYGRCKRTGSVPGEAPVKACPNCGQEVHAGTRECECGYLFPPPDKSHDERADQESEILSKPQTWIVEEVRYSRHEKKDGGPDAPATLRVDYLVRPVDSEGGDLETKTISEWVCVEHQGFARGKARKWWSSRCIDPMPDDAGVAADLARRGALAWPAKITTIKEGRWWRVLSAELEAKPEEWLDLIEEDTWEEVPF